MRDRIRRHPVLATGFVLALALMLFFAFRLAMWALFWPPAADARIEGWMTVGYIAQSHDVPREVLAAAIGLDPGTRQRISLARIAEDRGEALQSLVTRLDAAIAQHRSAPRD